MANDPTQRATQRTQATVNARAWAQAYSAEFDAIVDRITRSKRYARFVAYHTPHTARACAAHTYGGNVSDAAK